MWIVRHSSAARPVTVRRASSTGLRSMNEASSGDALCEATERKSFPSKRKMNARSAAHSLTALSANVSKTG
jgi:hypothetical protein